MRNSCVLYLSVQGNNNNSQALTRHKDCGWQRVKVAVLRKMAVKVIRMDDSDESRCKV